MIQQVTQNLLVFLVMRMNQYSAQVLEQSAGLNIVRGAQGPLDHLFKLSNWSKTSTECSFRQSCFSTLSYMQLRTGFGEIPLQIQSRELLQDTNGIQFLVCSLHKCIAIINQFLCCREKEPDARGIN